MRKAGRIIIYSEITLPEACDAQALTGKKSVCGHLPDRNDDIGGLNLSSDARRLSSADE